MDTGKIILAEFLGTFFFLSVILNVVADASLGLMAIPIALLASIYFGGKISGGHFNPAVSVMMFMKGSLAPELTIIYIIAQIAGALTALLLNMYFIS